MGEVLILFGGVAWILVVLTLSGYSTVLARAKQWHAASVGLACTIMLITLGIVCLQNAPYWARTWVWN